MLNQMVHQQIISIGVTCLITLGAGSSLDKSLKYKHLFHLLSPQFFYLLFFN